MPLHTPTRAFYGPEAKRLWKTTRDAFIAALDSALNSDDFQETINKPVVVTSSESLASALYDEEGDQSEAIIYVVRDRKESMPSGRKIDGQYYEGERHEMSFTLDFSMGETNAANPLAEAEADQDMADALSYFLKAHLSMFDAMGLQNIAISPDAEKQGAGVGRNPHRVSFLALTLPTYNPA